MIYLFDIFIIILVLIRIFILFFTNFNDNHMKKCINETVYVVCE
jgi:hypothetical protein